MEEFALQLRRRLDAAIPHGAAKKVAQYAGVHPNEVSRWGSLVRGRWQIPNLYEIARTAEILAVNPCWLAFERGAREEAAAAYGLRLGKECELDPELARLVTAYVQAPEDAKEVPRAWARSQPARAALADLLQVREETRRRAETRAATPAGHARKSRVVSLARVREEIESAVARLRLLESGAELSDRSKELLQSAAARLLALVPLQGSAVPAGRTSKAPDAGGTSTAIEPSGGRPASTSSTRFSGQRKKRKRPTP